jgi:hypothetical protein
MLELASSTALSVVACLKTRTHPGDLKVLDNMRLCGDRDISDTISTSRAFDSFNHPTAPAHHSKS